MYSSLVMKKRILLLTGGLPVRADSLNGKALGDWLGRELGNDFEVTYGALTELTYHVGPTASIYHATDGYDLADFDLVVFRTVGKHLELGITAATYLHAKGVKFTDPYLLMPGKGKLACSMTRWAAGIPVPETVYARPKLLTAAVKRHGIPYPLVLKADVAKKGRHNYLVQDEAELIKRAQAMRAEDVQGIVQPMIPNDGDYRVLVFGGTAALALFRTRPADSHLNNVSMGGQAELMPLRKLPAGVVRLAEQAAQLERLTVAGVDVIINQQTGHAGVLEVNRAPQLPTGAFAAEKMTAYAAALGRLTGGRGGGVSNEPIVIGRSEHLIIPDHHPEMTIPAKIDSGAYSSSIWASNMTEVDDTLSFCLFAPGSPHYTGTVFTVEKPHYSRMPVENSFGDVEVRYALQLSVRLHGKQVESMFTLTDRSKKIYPILVGRKLIRHGYVVDVRKGTPLTAEERRMRRAHRVALRENED